MIARRTLVALPAMLAVVGPTAATGAPAVPLPGPVRPVVEVAPGITYQRIAQPDSRVVHVVRARPSVLTRVEPVLAGGATTRRGDLAATVAANADRGVVAGVNGDYFNVTSSYPSGLTALGGRLVSEPEPTRAALVIDTDGTLRSGRLTLTGQWQAVEASGLPIGTLRSIAGVNRPAERTTEMLLYTADYGGPTPRGTSRNEAVVRVDGGAPLSPNGSLVGVVESVGEGGGTDPAPGTVVVTGHGSARTAVVRDLPVGGRVRITTSVAGLPAGASAVGGGPLLVDEGVAVPSFTEGFTSGQLTQRTSRTAVGQSADGGYVLATVEGPSQGRPGMSAAEQATLMRSLGARLAVGMDAGGSAQMVVLGGSVVPWSSPRAVTTAVALRYDGVRVAPTVHRLTPNGDGVDDATVAAVTAPRAGRLRVTLVRRGADTGPVLLDEATGGGTRQVRVDPLAARIADGPWAVTAELVPDDGTATTTARRAVVVDRTLARLTARPFRLRAGVRKPRPSVAISFTLLRPARVTVRVVDDQGRVRRTLRAGRSYRRGPVRFVWDRRIGKRVAEGAFRIEAVARTSLGTPGLFVPVNLAPIPVPEPRPANPATTPEP